MISIDTWFVTDITDDIVYLQCPFVDGTLMEVPVEELEDCNIGDVFSSETGGLEYLQYDELEDLSEKGRKIFFDYIKTKGFQYSDLEKYGFIAD